MGLYADDLAIWMKTSRRRIFDERLSRKADEIIRHLTSKGFRVNEIKTQAILFSGTKPRNEVQQTNIMGHSINLSDEIKYLGVVIDRHTTYRTHLKNCELKGRRTLNVLRMLSGKNWGCDSSTQKIIYKSK